MVEELLKKKVQESYTALEEKITFALSNEETSYEEFSALRNQSQYYVTTILQITPEQTDFYNNKLQKMMKYATTGALEKKEKEMLKTQMETPDMQDYLFKIPYVSNVKKMQLVIIDKQRELNNELIAQNKEKNAEIEQQMRKPWYKR
jgi:hypothetical protein